MKDAPVETVVRDGQTYAIVVRHDPSRRGHHFVSDPADALQVGVNHYDAGSSVAPHFHVPRTRCERRETLEVLHIDEGRCRLALFDAEAREVYATELSAGDVVVLLAGGHGITFLDSTRILEVKEGPYQGRGLDKILLDH